MHQVWQGFRLSAGIIVLSCLGMADAAAQAYPAKPIRVIVGFDPGGGVDFVARLVARRLADSLGQAVVVENRAGAGGAIATELVVKSPADGYTLHMLSSSNTTLPALRKLPFDTERDLAPVSMVATGASLLAVHPSVPAQNVRELIALARSRPGKLTYGSGGLGTAPHLTGILFTQMAKLDILHVPFKASAQSAIATASGEIDVGFFSVPAAQSLLAAGKIRALATLGAKRIVSMPSLPTLHESGVSGFDYETWHGMATPAAVPKDIIAQLNALIVREINTSEVRSTFSKLGLEPRTSTAEEFASRIRSDLELNARLIKLSGVKVE